MAIPVQIPSEVTTLPSGQELTTLNFNFIYVDASTVEVIVDGVELLSTQYSVSGQVVTFDPPITGAVGDSEVIVYISMVYARTNDLLQSSPIYSSDLNNQLDRIVLMLQQSEFGVSKSIIFPSADSDGLNTILPIATSRADRALVFNSDGSVGVGGDLYTNQVALCEAQVALATAEVALATTQATDSATSATLSQAWATQLVTPVSDSDYSAKYNANLAKDWADKATDVEDGMPSAKTWAQTASAIAIPEGSITNEKIADNAITPEKVQVGDYIFNNLTCNQSITSVGSITTTGQFHSTDATYGTELYTPYSSTVAFRCSRDADNRAVQLSIKGLGGGNYGGIGQYDLSGAYWSEINLDANQRPRINWNGGEGDIAMTSDLNFTAGSSGTTYFVKLPNGLIIQFGIFAGNTIVFPTQFTQVATVGVVVTVQTGNATPQIASQVTTTSCYVEHGQTTNNFIAIGY